MWYTKSSTGLSKVKENVLERDDLFTPGKIAVICVSLFAFPSEESEGKVNELFLTLEEYDIQNAAGCGRVGAAGEVVFRAR